jgi:hypothetical protein
MPCEPTGLRRAVFGKAERSAAEAGGRGAIPKLTLPELVISPVVSVHLGGRQLLGKIGARLQLKRGRE